jgi:hypothetical protein
MQLFKVVETLAVFGVLFLLACDANAADYVNSFSINGMPYSVTRSESIAGSRPIRRVALNGTHKLRPGESLTEVQVLWFHPQAGGSARGQSNDSSLKWSANFGDPLVTSYQIRFKIRRSGQDFFYFSPLFVYGRR